MQAWRVLSVAAGALLVAYLVADTLRALGEAQGRATTVNVTFLVVAITLGLVFVALPSLVPPRRVD